MSDPQDNRKRYQAFLWWVFWWTTPDFWRRLTTGRVRIKIFLASGQSFKVSVAGWNATMGNAKRYSAVGISNQFQIEAEQVIAWKEILYW